MAEIPSTEVLGNENPTAEIAEEVVPEEITDKGDLNKALHSERQEKSQLKTELQKMNEIVTDLQTKLKEKELAELPEEEQVDRQFKELTVEKVMSQISDEKLSALPPTLQKQLKENPWHFVDQKALDKETRFAEDKREFYKIAGTIALESINSLIEEYSAIRKAPEQKAEDADPSLEKEKGSITTGGYSASELMIMAQSTDPAVRARFDQIHQASRR